MGSKTEGMKQLGQFLKTTTLGGLFVLLPVVLLSYILRQVFQIATSVATPLASTLSKAGIYEPKFPVLLAIALMLIVSFILGVLALAPWGKAVGRWIESVLLMPFPGYRASKLITRSIAGSDDMETFKPVLIVSPVGQKEIAYLIEDHGDGNATVMMPRLPTPMGSSVKIVPSAQLQILPARPTDVTRVLGECGLGLRKLLQKNKSTSQQPLDPLRDQP